MRHNEIGKIGEDVACKFLMKKGFEIIEKNYLRKWGEIDIVAKYKREIHFIEVKTVSANFMNVNHETLDDYRAEDNVHEFKLDRLKRVIQMYLLDKRVGDEENWHFHVVTVRLDLETKKAKVRLLEDIVL